MSARACGVVVSNYGNLNRCARVVCVVVFAIWIGNSERVLHTCFSLCCTAASILEYYTLIKINNNAE